MLPQRFDAVAQVEEWVSTVQFTYVGSKTSDANSVFELSNRQDNQDQKEFYQEYKRKIKQQQQRSVAATAGASTSSTDSVPSTRTPHQQQQQQRQGEVVFIGSSADRGNTSPANNNNNNPNSNNSNTTNQQRNSPPAVPETSSLAEQLVEILIRLFQTGMRDGMRGTLEVIKILDRLPETVLVPVSTVSFSVNDLGHCSRWFRTMEELENNPPPLQGNWKGYDIVILPTKSIRSALFVVNAAAAAGAAAQDDDDAANNNTGDEADNNAKLSSPPPPPPPPLCTTPGAQARMFLRLCLQQRCLLAVFELLMGYLKGNGFAIAEFLYSHHTSTPLLDEVCFPQVFDFIRRIGGPPLVVRAVAQLNNLSIGPLLESPWDPVECGADTPIIATWSMWFAQKGFRLKWNLEYNLLSDNHHPDYVPESGGGGGAGGLAVVSATGAGGASARDYLMASPSDRTGNPDPGGADPETVSAVGGGGGGGSSTKIIRRVVKRKTGGASARTTTTTTTTTTMVVPTAVGGAGAAGKGDTSTPRLAQLQLQNQGESPSGTVTSPLDVEREGGGTTSPPSLPGAPNSSSIINLAITAASCPSFSPTAVGSASTGQQQQQQQQLSSPYPPPLPPTAASAAFLPRRERSRTMTTVVTTTTTTTSSSSDLAALDSGNNNDNNNNNSSGSQPTGSSRRRGHTISSVSGSQANGGGGGGAGGVFQSDVQKQQPKTQRKQINGNENREHQGNVVVDEDPDDGGENGGLVLDYDKGALTSEEVEGAIYHLDKKKKQEAAFVDDTIGRWRKDSQQFQNEKITETLQPMLEAYAALVYAKWSASLGRATVAENKLMECHDFNANEREMYIPPPPVSDTTSDDDDDDGDDKLHTPNQQLQFHDADDDGDSDPGPPPPDYDDDSDEEEVETRVVLE